MHSVELYSAPGHRVRKLPVPRAKEPHEILPFFLSGGVEILLVYFTLWTLAERTAFPHRAALRMQGICAGPAVARSDGGMV